MNLFFFIISARLSSRRAAGILQAGDRRQHVGHFEPLLSKPEQVYRQTEKQHATDSRHLGNDAVSEIGRYGGGEECERALTDEDAGG